MQSTQVESTYGEVVSPEKAPEAISKAVASLPPEQMYELVKQMKQCIQVVTPILSILLEMMCHQQCFIIFIR